MKSFWFLIVSTFVIGFLAGFVAFVTSVPEDTDTPLGDEPIVAVGEFEIIADFYGGCQLAGSCPSYRVLSDGSYEYLVSVSGEPRRFKGALSRSQLRELTVAFEWVNLGAIENTTFTGTCPAAFDGPAYRFGFFVGNDAYFIDTCEQDVSGVNLFEILTDFFDTFADLHPN